MFRRKSKKTQKRVSSNRQHRPLRLQQLNQRLLMIGDLDDQISEALLVSTGVTSGEIVSVSDVDMHAIALNAGDTIGIDIDSANDLYSAIRVFDSNGVELADSNGEPTRGPGDEYSHLEAFMTFTAPATDTFYIGVSSLDNEEYNALLGVGDNFFSFAPGGTYDLIIDLAPTTRTFFVNTVGDLPDARLGDGVAQDVNGNTSFRAAIEEANAIGNGNHYIQIEFDLPVSELHIPSFTYVIEPLTPLPTLEHTVEINRGQLSTSQNSDHIRIDGSNITDPNTNGLNITGPGVEVHWLEIADFTGNGIEFSGSYSSSISELRIEDNGGNGILLSDAVKTTVMQTNVYRNGASGIQISGAASSDNTVRESVIGLEELSSGLFARAGNAGDGIEVLAPYNDLLYNTIGENAGNGIAIASATAEENRITSNFIGTDRDGNFGIGNQENGILVNSPNNTIGFDNVISGNEQSGILITGPLATNNSVTGSRIGTDDDGEIAIPNGTHGVHLQEVDDNTIGGDSSNPNVISGNTLSGVVVSENASGNLIAANYIGINADGDEAIPNGANGVYLVSGATNTEVKDNHIAGNQNHQLEITGEFTTTNTASSNWIGFGPDITPIDGGMIAVLLESPNNTIGGDVLFAGNSISGSEIGISVAGAHATGNQISGNFVGTANQRPVFNDYGMVTGIELTEGAEFNTVGPDNVISFNSENAVQVTATAGPSNTITRNEMEFNGFGIDLGLDGPDTNDVDDPDVGPNQLQNKPVIASANSVPNSAPFAIDLVIQYSVDSNPSNVTYPLTVEFFLADSLGQGNRFIAEDTYTTTDHAVGDKSFLFTAIAAVGMDVTATVTDADGNTSEFATVATISSTLLTPQQTGILPIRLDPMDVDNNGVLSPFDALLIINELGKPDLDVNSTSEPGFSRMDTSRDGILSPWDVLLVLNRLHAESKSVSNLGAEPGTTQVVDRDDSLNIRDQALQELLLESLF